MYKRNTEKGSVWVTLKRCESSIFIILITFLLFNVEYDVLIQVLIKFSISDIFVLKHQ